MKRLFKYFVFPLCASFALLVNVNAAICGNAQFYEYSTTFPCIGEAPVRLCKRQHLEGPKPAEKGPFGSVGEATGSCETTYTAKANKHMVTVHIGPCSEEQVKIDFTCEYSYTTTRTWYECADGTEPTDSGCADGSEPAQKSQTIPHDDGKYVFKDQDVSTVGQTSTYEEKIKTEVDETAYNITCDDDIYLRYEYWDVICDEVGIASVCVNGEQFGSEGEAAYCINPSYLFPESGSTWDDSFEVTDCKNARSSKDCGYANILIEGERLGYSYGVISVALRLWGADETYVFDPAGGGFDDTGLPIQGAPTDPIDGERNFREEFVNIYKYTVASLNAYLKSGVKIEDIPSPEPGSNTAPDEIKLIPCDETYGIGRLCGNNPEYKKAIYLYINTIQGNPYMIDHLNEKFKNLGYDVSEYKMLDDVKVTNYNEEERIIELTEILKEDVEVECSILDDENKEYCRMPKQKIYTYIGGQKVLLADSVNNDLYYSYCKKNRCVVEVEPPVALCDLVQNEKERIIYVEWDEEQKITQRSVKKFVSCSSTAYNKEQIMFMFDIDDKLSDTSTTTHHSTTRPGGTTKEAKYVCKCADNEYDGPDLQAYGSGNFDKAIIDNSVLTTVGVNGSGLNNVCGNIGSDGKYTKENKYGNGPYDTLTKSSVFEPSLTKIVNMCRKSKQEVYDYSDYYGINSKVCKLYCRDEVTFYLSNKTKSSDGQPFKYDIAMRLKTYDNKIPNQIRSGSKKYEYYLVNGNKIESFQNKSSDPKLLTSVVVEQRECITDIYMNKQNADGDTWWDLYRSARAQGEQKQLIYDLENCNLFTGGRNNSKLNNNHRINVDVVVQAINITQDEKYTTLDYLDKTIHECDTDRNCPSMSLTYSDVDGERNVNIGMEHDLYISNVDYCSNGSSKCYEYYYDSSTKKAQDRLGGNHGYKSTSVSVYGAGSVTIPNNDYATFTITKEYDFYNNEQYYAKAGSGDITTEEGENRTKVDKYSYPVHASTTPSSYPITQNYTVYNTFYRKKKNDDFSKLLSKIKTYSCYIDVDDGTEECKNQCCKEKDCPDATNPSYGLGFSFKNIEPTNMFPATDTDPDWKGVYALNWDTPEATKVQNQIEASADEYFVSDKYLDYSVSLTPEDIKRIKKYNQDNNTKSLFTTKGYTNDTLYACSDPENNDGLILNCKSTFVNSIRKGEFGFTFDKIGGSEG